MVSGPTPCLASSYDSWESARGSRPRSPALLDQPVDDLERGGQVLAGVKDLPDGPEAG